MNKIKDLVTDKLQKINIEIVNEKELDEDNNEYMIATQDSIIIINQKRKDISISFHVSSRIEDAVIIALTLNEIKGFKIFVTEAFIFDDTGNYLDGDQAFELFESKKAEKVIKDFVKYQSEKHFLMQADGYKC